MSNSYQIAAPTAPLRDQADRSSLVELNDLKSILLHRRGLILGTAVLLTLLALIYGMLAAPQFSSTAEILIDPRDLQVVRNDLYQSSVAADGGIAQVESQVSVVQSTGVLMRAVEATGLTQDPEFNSQGLLGRLFGGQATPTADQEWRSERC